MENDNYLKHAGFALTAMAIALSAGAARASDKESWVWEDRGDRRVAVVMPAADVVYRPAPLRIVYTRPLTRRVIYTRPVLRRVYVRPTLFPSYHTIRWRTGRYEYAPVSSAYIQTPGYLEYR